MTITRDIVQDLLAVYLAGDASPDTRSLVEDWLNKDRDLARQVEAARRELPSVALPDRSVEMRALTSTKRRLRRKGILLGMAIWVTALPLTVRFNSEGFQGLMITDWPERAIVLSMAVVLWALYARVSRGLRVSGL
jgi:ferric-dicitrate binding protein FerR (iron transport regulator)